MLPATRTSCDVVRREARMTDEPAAVIGHAGDQIGVLERPATRRHERPADLVELLQLLPVRQHVAEEREHASPSGPSGECHCRHAVRPGPVEGVDDRGTLVCDQLFGGSDRAGRHAELPDRERRPPERARLRTRREASRATRPSQEPGRDVLRPGTRSSRSDVRVIRQPRSGAGSSLIRLEDSHAESRSQSRHHELHVARDAAVRRRKRGADENDERPLSRGSGQRGRGGRFPAKRFGSGAPCQPRARTAPPPASTTA